MRTPEELETLGQATDKAIAIVEKQLAAVKKFKEQLLALGLSEQAATTGAFEFFEFRVSSDDLAKPGDPGTSKLRAA